MPHATSLEQPEGAELPAPLSASHLTGAHMPEARLKLHVEQAPPATLMCLHVSTL